MQKLRIGLIVLGVYFLTSSLYAGDILSVEDTHRSNESVAVITQEKEETVIASIVSVDNIENKNVPNTDTFAMYQTVTLLFLEGEKKGEKSVVTDSVFNLKEGDKVYVRHITTADGGEYVSIQDVYRLPALIWLLGIFLVAILIIGGKQGFLSLIALFLSFGAICTMLFPSLLTGGNVIVVATLGALLSLLVAMFLTHGFSRLTVSAFLGCVGSVLITLFFALYAVRSTALTGFATEESVFLNLATQGSLDFVALLVGGIIIGVIGVIDDVAITQVSVVNELLLANRNLTRKEVYIKAMKVGKDHMGAVINTLILAYTGASLPLVLLVYVGNSTFVELINREVITTEIVRTIVGSIGLLSAIPLTTGIAILLLYQSPIKDKGSIHSHRH
ncbi:MAG: hypothetical protein RLZZ308_54 [Candidatus Parcubacteria bacterium]|jgi:uncharacterized membrane protein